MEFEQNENRCVPVICPQLISNESDGDVVRDVCPRLSLVEGLGQGIHFLPVKQHFFREVYRERPRVVPL